MPLVFADGIKRTVFNSCLLILNRILKPYRSQENLPSRIFVFFTLCISTMLSNFYA